MPAKTTGFASPALGYEEKTIDINAILVNNPAATYLWRLESGEMAALGLPCGSLLVVDRSRDPAYNTFVILRHEGQFLCRMLIRKKGKAAFSNGVDEFPPIANETEIIGVVTASIKQYP